MLLSTRFPFDLASGAILLATERKEPPRWYPPAKLAKNLAWIAWINAVASLLTNGYTLQWLEPTVSRRALVLLSLAVAAAISGWTRYGVPASREGWKKWARSLVVPALLILILAAAFGLRVWGITYGLPQSYIPDEYDYVHSALKKLKTGDFNPRWWYYPSLQPYLCTATYLAVYLQNLPSGRWAGIHQVTEEDMLYWGRFLGVVFGTLTVLVTFLLGRSLFSTKVGLVSAALLAVFPGAVEHSQYNKPDVVLYFAVVVSVIVTLTYLGKGGYKLAFACGVAIGLATATKYNGVLLAAPFLIAVALRQRRRLFSEVDLYVGAVGAVMTFVVINPYFLADFPRFLEHVSFDIYSYGYLGRPGAEGDNNWYTHAVYTARYGAGFWVSLFAVAGLVIALYRARGSTAVFLSFPILYYSHYGAQRINWAGNLIAVYPFLAILAGYALYEFLAVIVRRMGSKRYLAFEPVAAVLLLVVLIWSPLRTSIRFNTELTLPDTGNVAREWIDGAFPPGTSFAVERHAPVPDRKKYKVMQEARIIQKALRSYRDLGVGYFVVSSQVYERFGPEHRLSKAYDRLFQACPLVRKFEPLEGELQGPTIRVLKVPPE